MPCSEDMEKRGGTLSRLYGCDCRAQPLQAEDDWRGVLAGAAQLQSPQCDHGARVGGHLRVVHTLQRHHRCQVLHLFHALRVVQQRPIRGGPSNAWPLTAEMSAVGARSCHLLPWCSGCMTVLGGAGIAALQLRSFMRACSMWACQARRKGLNRGGGCASLRPSIPLPRSQSRNPQSLSVGRATARRV
jgi:hypothetical protein